MSQKEIQSHNQNVLAHLEEGDLIEFPRGLFYSHWAVYIGEEEVVHLAGDPNAKLKDNVNSGHFFTVSGMTFSKAHVKKDNFWDVVCDSKAKKNNYKDTVKGYKPKPKRQIVEDALSKLGTIGYNAFWSNCEHFASLCRYDVEKSDQVDSLLKWAVGILAAVVIVVSALVKPRNNQNKS